MKIVIAPDSFKGGPSASEVADALADGWRGVRPEDEVVCLPLADGGEGTLDALRIGVPGATRRVVRGVTGPDGRPVDAHYLLLPDGTAVVEMAAVSGLPLMAAPDPLGATSRGVGEVVAAALDAGATRIVLGVGGSASTDGGTGALASLGARFLDRDGETLADGGGALRRLASVDLSSLREAPARGLEILTDVDSPLLGPHGSAAVFGPQKGATPDDVAMLDAGLARLAERLGGRPEMPGAGAAGGIAYGFAAAWDATLRLGSRAVAEELALGDHVRGADLVITGEGRLDHTSLRGKVVSAVLEHVADGTTALAIVAGVVADDVELGVRATVLSLTELAGSAARSLAEPGRWLRLAARRLAEQHTD
ncbi:MAG TPA: glycerate kinase [Egicoccus sp.]|nr:glycerate kinase [Egicoccus sp.]HSK24334.1 glycerate kinase [Egicoccus sp.]